MYPRHVLAALLLASLTASPVHGQATVTEADSAGTASALNRLTIVPDLPGGVTPPGQVVAVGRTLHWDAFVGSNPLPEPDFYHMIGRLELEQKARSVRRNRLVALGAGALGMAIGTVLFSQGYDGKDRPAISVPHLVGGFMIPLGGLTVGVSLMTLPHRRVPMAIAQEMADEYNRGRGMGSPAGD